MKKESDAIVTTSVGPIDLTNIAKVAKETGSVSPPVLVRLLHFPLHQAESALFDLAERGYLEILPESGLVKTYSLTPVAYEKIEKARRQRSIFSGLFQHESVS